MAKPSTMMIADASAAAGSGSQFIQNMAPTMAAKGARKIQPVLSTGPIPGISLRSTLPMP